MKNMTRFMWAVTLLTTVVTTRVWAEPPSPDKAKEAVLAFLAGHQIQGMSERLQEITDPALTKTFPAQRFFLLRFPLYPVARVSPPPLQQANIFAVDDKLHVTLIVDTDTLLTLFKAAAPQDAPIRTATAWALLDKELVDDGMFHLHIQADHIAVQEQGTTKTVLVPVEPAVRGGNAGVLKLYLTFDAAGRVVSQRAENALRSGPRPICQSMRLNDPDPAIRGKAERELLLMGRDALPYLRSRRLIVSPVLQQKIQAVIEKIAASPNTP